MSHAQNSTAVKASAEPAAPSLPAPWGTLVLCLLTIGTAMAQSIWGWQHVAEATGVAKSHVSLFSLTGISEGQAIPTWLTLVTYLFPHEGWWHVLPNMTALWLFGVVAERAIGTWRFVAGYFVSGVVGAFCYALVVPNTMKPLAGASLAIAGLVGAYASWRWLDGRPTAHQRFLGIVPEVAAVAGVIAWLVVRTVPATPNLLSSVMYHFIPFLAMWLVVQAYCRCRSIHQRVYNRAA